MFVPAVTFGTSTVPVSVGDASGAFSASAALVITSCAVFAAVTNAVFAALVLLSPAVTLGTVGVPVSAGDARLALRLSAVCCAVLTGLAYLRCFRCPGPHQP